MNAGAWSDDRGSIMLLPLQYGRFVTVRSTCSAQGAGWNIRWQVYSPKPNLSGMAPQNVRVCW
jgi:hypothetical protein